MIASPAAASPAWMAASTSLTEPPMTIRYLPEQIVRAISSSTEAALSISSSIWYPMPMLDSSIAPMDLGIGMGKGLVVSG